MSIEKVRVDHFRQLSERCWSRFNTDATMKSTMYSQALERKLARNFLAGALQIKISGNLRNTQDFASKKLAC